MMPGNSNKTANGLLPIHNISIVMKKAFVIIIAIASITFGCKPKSTHEDKVDSSDTSGKADVSAVKQAVDTTKSIAPDKLIMPGKGIGKMSVGESADSLAALFGKPDSSDAAMGSALDDLAAAIHAGFQ